MESKYVDFTPRFDAGGGMEATLQSRYYFTPQYIYGSALLALRAQEIEQNKDANGLQRAEHRALVVGAVMQAAAAIEAEFNEVAQHGPGGHLGSNGVDAAARDVLEPIADVLDGKGGVLQRWQELLRRIGKPPLELGGQPCLNAQLLVELRNELLHFRSKWEGQTKRPDVLQKLRGLKLPKSPLASEHSNFFPEQLLAADCAKWAVTTAAHFIDEAYSKLGVSCVLDGLREPGCEFEHLVPPRADQK